jgi:glycosyltransferase involved in cell wall biosynthesis
MDIKELLVRAGGMSAKASKLQGRSSQADQKKETTAGKTISIVIPAHNEEAYLKRTLMALRRQKYRTCEIIVVANGCTDGTADVARGRCDRLVVLSQKSLGVARNLGARMAKGDLLIFLDADTLLQRNALQIIAENFSSKYAAGTVKGKPDSTRLAYRIIYFIKNLTHQSSLHHGSSGVIICWKEHFIRLGGFNEHLEVRENSDLIRRLECFGRYNYIGKAAAITSMRRYERRGVWRMVWMWIRLWFESLFKDLQHRKYEIVR